MLSQKKLIVSHAPFVHNGSGVPEKNRHIIYAALPAVIFGMAQFGPRAVAVVALSVASAIFWELLFNKVAKRDIMTIGDCNAALTGLVFAMLLPAGTPWWVVLSGTFIAIVVGIHIFGGIGSNPFHPAVTSVAILTISWPRYLNFDQALVNFDFNWPAAFPLTQLKYFGTEAISQYPLWDLFMGHQTGGIGSVFGLGLILGGVYLILRGFIRWEISVSFLLGITITALLFQLADPAKYAGPGFHLLTGYTLIGAFFLATENSSSPVNVIPMFIYGAMGGIMTMLIRNIGAYVDGVIYAILIINLISPLVDKIRPKAVGSVNV